MSHENTIRLYAGVILFVLTLLVGTVPIYVLEYFSKRGSKRVPSTTENQTNNNDGQWKERIVSFLTQVGGGVLFYTAYVHMLPEIREHYETYLNATETKPVIADSRFRSPIVRHDDADEKAGDGGPFSDLPVVDLLACGGLFGIFLLEEVMHFLLGGNHQHHHHHHHHYHHDNEGHSVEPQPTATAAAPVKRRFSLRQCLDKQKYDPQIDDETTIQDGGGNITPSNVMVADQGDHHHRGCGDNYQRATTAAGTAVAAGKQGCGRGGGVRLLNVTPFSETQPISTGRSLPLQCYNTCSQPCTAADHRHSYDVERSSATRIEPAPSLSSPTPGTGKNHRHSVWPHIIDNFLLILAFSCHSIFDGISIGVQQTENDIWPMLIAILSHKLIIAFILAFQIYEKCMEKTSDQRPAAMVVRRPIPHAKLILWLFSGLFALMSPLGILLVMVMDNSQTPDETNLKIIILAAISAGTILYIVFFEIVDKSSSRVYISGLVQWVALVIGFSAMHFISHAFHEAD